MLYLLLWYLGPWQGIPFLDFTGQQGRGILLVAALLVVVAYFGRRRQVISS